jgi:serine/threonine-protein kinase
MGVVYLAEDPVLGREVAIKAIQVHPGLSEQQISELRQRFETEAKAAARLSHPHLVTIFDAGLEDENLYIAMEFVEGQGLDAMLAAGSGLGTAEIAELIGQLGAALDYAHERGIVHRDIKPANVLVSRHGFAKITDFGVARHAASTLTATGAMIGTPAYMSPEQVKGEPVSGSADQFSLAIMAYELLTGERPFEGEGTTTILYKIVHEEPSEPRALRPDLGASLSEVVLRAMSKDPAARYPSCAEFAAALAAALGSTATAPGAGALGAAAASQTGPGLATDPDAATALDASTGGVSARLAATTDTARTVATNDPASGGRPSHEPARPARGVPLPILLGGGAVLLIGAIVAIAVLPGGSDTPPEPAPAVAPPPAADGIEADPSAGLPGAAQIDPAQASTVAPAASGSEQPVMTRFRVTTRPPGARLMLDGELVTESTPAQIEVSAGDEHTVLLEMAGHSTVSWRFVPADLPEEQRASGQLFFPLRPSQPAAGTAGENAPPDDPRIEDLPPVDPVRVRGGAEPPDLVEKGADPEMPEWALEQGLQRYVILELVIDREGRVRDARPLQAVHPELEQLAIAAVRTWQFAPARRDGEAIDAYHNVSVQFRQPDRPGPA